MAKSSVHRALVLQGGGSLGAYEAGVFNTLYYWIKKKTDTGGENDAIKAEIDAILNTPSKSSHRTGERRTFRDLVTKRFDITKIIRIERSVDKDDIANKWCDFSLGSISNLFNQGIQDALKTLVRKVKISENIQASYLEVDLFIHTVEKQNANPVLIQSAENVKAMLEQL